MDESVIRRLVTLNQSFYEKFASQFAETRAQPQPGFKRIAEYLPKPCSTLLDVGCGNGRFGKYVLDAGLANAYTGVDASNELLDMARNNVPGEFYQRDLSVPGQLKGLGQFDAIACLATLQHIPGRDNRQLLLQEVAGHLRTAGVIILSTWQFLNSNRQRKKIVDWSSIGLYPTDVERDDYLLTWQRGGHGLRYVAYIDLEDITSLADYAGLKLAAHFYSDGREGNLNLYSVLSF